MATFDGFDAYARHLGRLSDELKSDAQVRMSHAAGRRAKELAERAASADLGGDPKFSGWAPTLDTRYDLVDDGLVLKPTRRSAGPWTVAEFGRNAAEGPRSAVRLTRSGRVSTARQRRWNGRTVGKGTASDAHALMERELPGVMERELRRFLSRFFD